MHRVVLATLRTLTRTLTRTQSDRTVLVHDSGLCTVPLRRGQRTGRRSKFEMEGESKAEEEKCVAASRFGVSDNSEAAFDDEPSSTSPVRFCVLNPTSDSSSTQLSDFV